VFVDNWPLSNRSLTPVVSIIEDDADGALLLKHVDEWEHGKAGQNDCQTHPNCKEGEDPLVSLGVYINKVGLTVLSERIS